MEPEFSLSFSRDPYFQPDESSLNSHILYL